MPTPLPHPNIEPPPGAQLDSAALGAIFAEIQRNLDALSGKFPVTGGDLGAKVGRVIEGGAKMASGAVNLPWSGASQFAGVVVNHGLGVSPSEVQLTSALAPGGFYVIACYSTYSATSITVAAFAPQGNPSAGNSNLSWRASA